MFNDQYGLTEAVLDGRKTQTRRIAYKEPFKYYCNCGFYTEGKDKGKLAINDGNEIVAKSTYKIGEVVAVAQRYSDIPYIKELHPRINTSEGWGNKMFVKSDLMPHQIKITKIWCERSLTCSTDKLAVSYLLSISTHLVIVTIQELSTNGSFTSRLPGTTPLLFTILSVLMLIILRLCVKRI